MDLKEQWIEAAKIELNGKEPQQFLSKNWDGFIIKPYYDYSEARSNTELISEKFTVPFYGSNGWLNLPLITLSPDEKANDIALDHLQHGADGIFFQPGLSNSAEGLLNEIKPECSFLGFEPQNIPLTFFQELSNHFSASQLQGAIFWPEAVGQNQLMAIAKLFKGYDNFRCHGILLKSDNSAEEIIHAVKVAMIILDVLTDHGFTAQSVFQQLAFSLKSSDNFFLDVAKIRGIKVLMKRLSAAYQVTGVPTFVRMVSEPDVKESYQPQGCLLNNSFHALSAVTASADAVTIITDNPISDVHVRTARNISLLLREESKLDKVMDPFAGSYFIESLTNSIVERVWATITSKI